MLGFIVLSCVFAMALNIVALFGYSEGDLPKCLHFISIALVILAIILLAVYTLDDEAKCVCGAVVNPEWSYCAECGTKLEADR